MVLEWHNSSWNSRFLALERNGLYWSPKNPFLEEHYMSISDVGNTQQSFITWSRLVIEGIPGFEKVT